MDRENRPLDLKQVRITDEFWQTEQELVRREVIPYQWEALNDRVPGANPSFAMHNFRAAKALRARSHEAGFVPPAWHGAPFETLPEDPARPEEGKFYGFLFQDTDLYKWLEAVAYSLTSYPDPALQATADEAIRLIADAQAEDGYLDTYYILNGRGGEFTNLRDHHELYCFGHLAEAAAAYRQATGNTLLLSVAEKFAAYIAAHIGAEEGKKHGYPGHEIAEMALVRLYRETGNEAYLNLSRYFIDERGRRPYYFDTERHEDRFSLDAGERYDYHQAHRPVREQDEALGHAVRAMYLYSGMADIARLTGDESLKTACRRLFRSTAREKMYVTGGVGSTHIGEAFTFPFDLPNDTAYTETCAAIGLCFFARRMLQWDVRAEYADVMERALYNGVLSGMALDGKSFFYVNPLEVWPEADRRDARKHHVKTVRQKWFGCACCPPNIARMIGSLGAYAYTEGEKTLFVHLYMGSEAVKTAGDRAVRVRTGVDRGDFSAWNVTFEIEAGGADFTLAARIPAWCRGKYTLRGAEGARVTEADGYLYVTKDWRERETLTLRLETPVRFLRADSRVREDAGCAAVAYGPFVYCAEEVDNGKDLHRLVLPRETKPEDVRFERTEIAGRTCTALLLPARRERAEEDRGLYFDDAEPLADPVTLRMIPYFMWANRGENEMRVWIRR